MLLHYLQKKKEKSIYQLINAQNISKMVFKRLLGPIASGEGN